MKYFKSMLCLGLLLWSAKGFSLTFQLPTNGDNVVGKVQWTQSLPGDDFITVGRRYDIGYYELVEANPGVDPNLPHPGTLLVIPSRFVIPNVPHKGIVVSLA
ncbi:MAG TPA: peptidase M23, partial [Gammaproteobacteria bacterium]|nr:peptidase M23 [Gammaproteobacteria bacterium]